jgi:glycosyltransferase involved in cell wall biosynthesis
MKKTKICLNAMVANEARTITRMLDSCYKYIDYWVIQDNGSTDGTQDIIRDYFQEKGIPGFLYETEWQYPGFNRDHTLQTCLKADHGCDWILRMDADEQLVVEDDFDWTELEDTNIESFNVIVHSFGSRYYRTWLWNAKLPWFFAHDKRHETIHLPEVGEDFQRVVLSEKFRHVVTNDGQTWFAPRKFLRDALELEIDKVVGNTILDDGYHFWYVAKSYSDCYGKSDDFAFGKEHSYEYARRAVFYYDQWLKRYHNYPTKKEDVRNDEMAYMGLLLRGAALEYMGDIKGAESSYIDAELFSPGRNEHMVSLAFLYNSQKRWDDVMRIINVATLPERTNPFPKYCFLIEDRAYHNTGVLWKEMKEQTLRRIQEPVIQTNSLDFDFDFE